MNAIFIKSSQATGQFTGFKSCYKQLGGMMIESLIGLLILSVIGGGVMHATARMANTQQQQTMNNIAVNQMRTIVMNRTSLGGADICSANNHTIKVPGQSTGATLTVKGCGNTALKVQNVETGSDGILPAQDVASLRPVVLEVGSGTNKIRVGGKEVTNVTPQ